ncbi:MAG: DUF2066 domain-containing protein [Gammaproteobacteria bacterium]|nr:DUF2066 domain-containing protein [Gammaproteobacteria bacterium]
MKPYLKIFALCAILFSCSHSAFASIVTDLYRSTLPVTNQSKQQRNKVIKTLFSQVLVKVSGNKQVLDNPQIVIALKKAMTFTSGFNFNRINNRLFLSATFNEQLVDQLLKSAGLSIWGKRRPSVMLWLGFEDSQQQRNVLNENSDQTLISVVQQQASSRGMPLLLPVWDLEDQLLVEMMDIWGLFSENVAQANKRYQTDFMILAKVYQSGVSYRMSWVIYQVNQSLGQPAIIFGSGSDEFSTQSLAMTAVIDQSTDFFSRQFSVDTQTQAAQLQFDVLDVDTIETYVAVSNYLTSLKAIESLQLIEVIAGKYRFVANILGEEKSLLDTINLEKKLVSQQRFTFSQLIEFRWHQSKRLIFTLDDAN